FQRPNQKSKSCWPSRSVFACCGPTWPNAEVKRMSAAINNVNSKEAISPQVRTRSRRLIACSFNRQYKTEVGASKEPLSGRRILPLSRRQSVNVHSASTRRKMPTSITETAISLRVRSPSFKVSSEWCSNENADFARRGNIADRCEPHREQATQIRQRIQ